MPPRALTRLLFSCLLLLTACKDITHVQTGYISDRDECRARSENGVGVYSQPEAYPMNDKERNTALLQLFCECMRDKDWKVAGCPKPATAIAATPAPAPTVVVVQAPTAQPAIMAEQPAPAAAPVAAPPKKKHVVCVPPGTCPAPPAQYESSSPQNQLQENQQLNSILQRQ